MYIDGLSSKIFVLLCIHISIEVVSSVHINELKKRSDIRLLFGPKQPGPDDKLCSFYMNELMKLAKPIGNEITVNREDKNSSFQYFLKKVTESGIRHGISNKTPCVTQMVTGFKPNNNLLYDYWYQNFHSKLL